MIRIITRVTSGKLGHFGHWDGWVKISQITEFTLLLILTVCNKNLNNPEYYTLACNSRVATYHQWLIHVIRLKIFA